MAGRSVRRSIVMAMLVGVLGWAMAWAADPAAPATATAPATAPARATHTVRRGTLSFQYEADGAFQAVEPFEARLRLKAYAGPLTVVAGVAHGAAVKKGDVLLELDPAPMQKDLIAAENDLAAARAAMHKVEDDAKLGEESDKLALKMTTADMQNATAAVSWWDKFDGPRVLKDADVAVQQRRHSVEDQQDELEQLRKMYKSEELTSATADIVVKRAVRTLELSKYYLAVQESLAEKTKTNDYAIAKAKVDDGLTAATQKLAALKSAQEQAKVLRQTALVTARLAQERAEKRLADLKADAEWLTIRAPLDGVALHGAGLPAERQKDGTWLPRKGDKLDTASGVALSVYVPGKLRAALDLPEAKLLWVPAGSKATVTPAALGGVRYQGKCLAPARARGGVEVVIDAGDVDPRLAPGMKAKVRIDGGKAENVLLVPAAAVTGGKVTVRAKDGATSERTVTTGRSDDRSIEITEGLAEGDEVVMEAGK